MHLGIIGTRGIPNHYGGFEQFAEYLAVDLAAKGYRVTVYNSHSHPYQKNEYKGVEIRHCYDPEDVIGTVGQFVYDFNCIRDSRSQNFDVILQLGYTSSSVWHWLMPKASLLVTNMDGLEWKRSKYSRPVQRFLKWAERLAVESSDRLIADSIGIQEYLQDKYGREARYIAYGANPVHAFNESVLGSYGLTKGNFNLIIARLEPENNIEPLIEGHLLSNVEQKLVVVGKTNTAFGKQLVDKYEENNKVLFLGGIYNKDHLDVLRWGSNFYYHGHSVGGTNPSLLEAMAAHTSIIAHDNTFNRSILEDGAYFFGDRESVAEILKTEIYKNELFATQNKTKIEKQYSWKKINTQYEEYILECLEKEKRT